MANSRWPRVVSGVSQLTKEVIVEPSAMQASQHDQAPHKMAGYGESTGQGASRHKRPSSRKVVGT